MHEAVLGVSKVLVDSSEHKSYSDPQVGAQFQSFFFALMDKQKEYYDELCSQESPNATRERLADLAASLGIDRAAFIEATKVGKSNGGTPGELDWPSFLCERWALTLDRYQSPPTSSWPSATPVRTAST